MFNIVWDLSRLLSLIVEQVVRAPTTRSAAKAVTAAAANKSVAQPAAGTFESFLLSDFLKMSWSPLLCTLILPFPLIFFCLVFYLFLDLRPLKTRAANRQPAAPSSGRGKTMQGKGNAQYTFSRHFLHILNIQAKYFFSNRTYRVCGSGKEVNECK